MQVIPVDAVNYSGTVWQSFILYTEVFGRPYYCYLEYVLVQFNSNKKNIIQTDDCNVESCVNRCNLYCEFYSIWFYMCNVRLYICFVSCWVLNLYITSCVLNLSLQFLYIRCFGECEPFSFFLFFEKGFLQEHERHRTEYSETAYTLSFCRDVGCHLFFSPSLVVDEVKHPECSPPYLEKGM